MKDRKREDELDRQHIGCPECTSQCGILLWSKTEEVCSNSRKCRKRTWNTRNSSCEQEIVVLSVIPTVNERLQSLPREPNRPSNMANKNSDYTTRHSLTRAYPVSWCVVQINDDRRQRKKSDRRQKRTCSVDEALVRDMSDGDKTRRTLNSAIHSRAPANKVFTVNGWCLM